MATSRSVHQFDPDRASRFRPRASFVKTAVLVDVSDPDAVTTIRTQFGEQTMHGPFYAVAEGADSYGAAQHEFESAHDEVEPGRWVKTQAVAAYRAEERCTVVTDLANGRESTVDATPGDWIIRQHTGEMMVVGAGQFHERYEPISTEECPP